MEEIHKNRIRRNLKMALFRYMMMGYSNRPEDESILNEMIEARNQHGIDGMSFQNNVDLLVDAFVEELENLAENPGKLESVQVNVKRESSG